MAVDFWPIVGYGVRLTEDMIDYDKAVELIRSSGREADPVTISVEDVMTHLADMSEGVLTWASTCDIYNENYFYLYVPAVLPLETDLLDNLTPQAVEQMIQSLLSQVVKDGVILPQVHDIFDVGCC